MPRAKASPAAKSGASNRITIARRAVAWVGALPDAEKLVRRVVGAVLADRRVGPGRAAEIGVVLAGDAFVRRLNREHRRKDKPTNVLSFPIEDAHHAAPSGRPPMLGDIVLAFGTVRREARAEGKPFADHAAHLLVHGTLHLLGFDHMTPREAAAMEAHEVRILAGLGVADPYRLAAAA